MAAHTKARHRLQFRPANTNDRDLLLEWANDPQVRQSSFGIEAVTNAEHDKWFQSRLNDANTRLWLFESGGVNCGMTRLERHGDDATISYLLAASFRGKGLAVEMLRIALNEIKKIWPSINVVAWSKPENHASIRSLESVGFQKMETQLDQLCFTFKVSP